VAPGAPAGSPSAAMPVLSLLSLISRSSPKQLDMVFPELLVVSPELLAKVALWSVDSELPLECSTAQRRRARTGGELRMCADECGSDARPLDAGHLHTFS